MWFCLTPSHKNRDYCYVTVNGQFPKIKAYVQLVSQSELLLLEHIHIAAPVIRWNHQMQVQDFWACCRYRACSGKWELSLKVTELLDSNLQLWKLSNILTTCWIKISVLSQTAQNNITSDTKISSFLSLPFTTQPEQFLCLNI